MEVEEIWDGRFKNFWKNSRKIIPIIINLLCGLLALIISPEIH